MIYISRKDLFSQLGKSAPVEVVYPIPEFGESTEIFCGRSPQGSYYQPASPIGLDAAYATLLNSAIDSQWSQHCRCKAGPQQGRCACITYYVRTLRVFEHNGSTQFWNYYFPGPIMGLRRVNEPGGGTTHYITHGKCERGELVGFHESFCGFGAKHTATIVSVQRVDGQPDNCLGDLPPPLPISPSSGVPGMLMYPPPPPPPPPPICPCKGFGDPGYGEGLGLPITEQKIPVPIFPTPLPFPFDKIPIIPPWFRPYFDPFDFDPVDALKKLLDDLAKGFNPADNNNNMDKNCCDSIIQMQLQLAEKMLDLQYDIKQILQWQIVIDKQFTLADMKEFERLAEINRKVENTGSQIRMMASYQHLLESERKILSAVLTNRKADVDQFTYMKALVGARSTDIINHDRRNFDYIKELLKDSAKSILNQNIKLGSLENVFSNLGDFFKQTARSFEILQDLQNRFRDELFKKLFGDYKTTNDRLAAIEKSLKGVEEDIVSRVRNAIKESEKQIQQSLVDSYQFTRDRLVELHSLITQSFAKLSDRFGWLETNIALIQLGLAPLTATLPLVLAGIKGIGLTLGAVVSSIGGIATSLTALSRLFASLQSQVVQIGKSVNDLDRQIDSIDRQIDTIDRQVDRAVEALQTEVEGTFDGANCDGDGEPIQYGANGIAGLAAQTRAMSRQIGVIKQVVCKSRDSAIAAIPEWWQVRVGADRPQLIILFAEKVGDKKFGAPHYAMTIPHFDPTKRDKLPFIESYIKGQIQVVWTLKDNSKFIINVIDQAEGERVIKALKPILNEKMLTGLSPKIGPRGGPELAIIAVYPRIARFFATGQKNALPTWEEYFDAT